MAGWVDQLPEDLRTNEVVTTYAEKTLGDFTKDTLGRLQEYDGKVKTLEGELTTHKTKVTDLEGRVANSLPKLTEKSTDEERSVYYKALGVPDKPEGYEFTKKEGEEQDPRMVSWAQETFHKAHLTKEQAALVADQWTSFIKEFNQEMLNQEQEELKTEMETLRKDLGVDVDRHIELGKRFFKKITEKDFDPGKPVSSVDMLRLFIKAGVAIGEDWSPKGSVRLGGTEKEGMVYDKSPTMPVTTP